MIKHVNHSLQAVPLLVLVQDLNIRKVNTQLLECFFSTTRVIHKTQLNETCRLFSLRSYLSAFFIVRCSNYTVSKKIDFNHKIKTKLSAACLFFLTPRPSAADLVNHVADVHDARPLHSVQLSEQWG